MTDTLIVVLVIVTIIQGISIIILGNASRNHSQAITKNSEAIKVNAETMRNLMNHWRPRD